MKNKKFISLIMVLIILISSSVSVFAIDEATKDKAREEGWNTGHLDGLIKGAENSSKKIDQPYYNTMPSSSEVYSKHKDKLKNKDQDYKNFFYIGYTEGFRAGYEENYRGVDSKLDETKTNYADSLASLLGEIYGFRDYFAGARSNWSKACPTNTNLSKMYDLKNQTSSYRSSFYSKFRDSFKKSYEDGYEKANLEGEKVNAESGMADGETVGSVLGNIHGAKDYFENRTNNYSRNKPSDTAIVRDYSLNNDSPEYKSGFLIGFKRSFEEAYSKSYRDSNMGSSIGNTETAYEDGRLAGLAKGELQANHDYIGKKDNNWKMDRIYSSQIITEYNLVYQSSDYNKGFVSGFLGGFTEGYNQAYNQLSQSYVVEKSIVAIIPKSGGVITTKDGDLTVEIEKGTFFDDVSISIETLSDSNSNKDNRYIKTSKLYNIEITNSSGNVNNDNKIKLSFNYFDNYKGGVYKKINNEFVYMNSNFEEDEIISNISPNTLTSKGNIYCVLIDKDVSVFPDARGNWANDEINTLVRRGIIKGYSDGYFKPELNVTRAEFLTLLSRVYDWKLKDNKNIEEFKDYNKFGNSDKIISYAIDKGYIYGYGDNTFKPDNPISYREIEIIMARVLEYPEFKWYNTAAKIMYEKQKRSNSYNSMDNKANRAEIVYMLYILNEGRY